MTNQATCPITIEHIRVRADRIECMVRVASCRYAMTDAALMARVLKKVPTVQYHACRNHRGPLFAAVMNATSVPHLLEHLIVDAQTRASQDDTRIFTGTTQWIADSDSLVALVSISYEDDLVALGAIKQSVQFLNEVLGDLRPS